MAPSDMEEGEAQHLDWLGLRWSAWMPLMAAHPLALAQLPSPAGLYRIRTAGTRQLLWVGWAEAGVRETVERLSRQVHLPVQPFDDPASPALLLWRLRHTVRAFEVSGAAYPGDGAHVAQALRAGHVSSGTGDV